MKKSFDFNLLWFIAFILIFSLFIGCTNRPISNKEKQNAVNPSEITNTSNKTSSQIIQDPVSGSIEPLIIKRRTPSVTGTGDIIKEISLDAVRDKSGNTYYYLPENDFLCGFQKKNYYGFHEEKPIGLDAAIKIAEEYLTKNIPDFKRFSLIYSNHSENDAIYHLQFSYHIHGIATDEMISVYVQENGEIGSFMVPFYGSFDNVTINIESVNRIPKDENSPNEYITINDEGIILVRYVEVVKGGIEVLELKSYLIGELK